MTTFVFPTLSINPARLQLTLKSNTQVFRSPLNGQAQVLELTGARWRAAWSYARLQEADAALLQAFLLQLRGQANDFTMYNWSRPVPRGTINLSGVTLNNDVAQFASTVNLSGCGAARTLVAGDYLGIAGALHMVVGGPTYTASGGGAMTSVSIEPPVRTASLAGVSVTTDKPTVKMMLEDPAASWSAMPAQQTGFELSAEERF